MRSLIEASLDPLVTMNSDGRIHDVNEAMIKITGVARETLTGTDFAGYFSDPKLARDLCRRVVATESVIDYALTFRRQDGHLTDVAYNASVYRDIGGNLLGVLAIAREVTESRKADLQFRTIIESAPDAMLLIADGIILLMNSQTERLFGYRREELLGKHGEILIPLRFRGTVVERRSKSFHELLRRQPENGQQLLGLRKDGSEFPIEISLSSIESAQDSTVGVTIRDVAVQRAASQHVRGLLETSLDPFLTISPDGKITDANEATVKITGVSREKLAGTDFSDYFTAPEQARDNFLQVLANGGVSDRPLTIRRLDGHLTDVVYNASVYKDVRGSVLGVFAAARDVTESRKAEQRFRTVVESAPDGMVLIGKDGIIFLVNKQTERLFGYKRDELLGEFVELLVPPRFRGIHPEHRTKFFQAPSSRPMGEKLQLWGLRKDGTEFPVEISLSPIESPQGMTVVATIRDVSIQQTAAQYARSLLEASLHALVTISPEGKITDVNEWTIKVTGIPRETLIGTDFSDYFTDPDRARAGYMQVFEKGTVTDYPLTIRHRNQTLIEVLYNASIYRDIRGNVLGVFAGARDMTVIRRAEAEVAEQRQQDLERLADLERFQRVTVGRELKMIELKREVQELKKGLVTSDEE